MTIINPFKMTTSIHTPMVLHRNFKGMTKEDVLLESGWVALSSWDARKRRPTNFSTTADLHGSMSGGWYAEAVDPAHGKMAYIKSVKPNHAIQELLGSSMAQTLGLPAPPVQLIVNNKAAANDEDKYLFLSQPMGTERWTLLQYQFSGQNKVTPFTPQIVVDSLSFQAPCWEFFGHRDCSRSNIIVARCSEETTGRERFGVYGIDFAYANIHLCEERTNWENKLEISFNEQRFNDGVDKIKTLSDAKIKEAVHRVLVHFTPDEMARVAYPSEAAIVERFCQNREEITYFTRPLLKEPSPKKGGTHLVVKQQPAAQPQLPQQAPAKPKQAFKAEK